MGQYDLLKHEKHMLLHCQYHNDIDFQKYLDLETRLAHSPGASILSPGCDIDCVRGPAHTVSAQKSYKNYKFCCKTVYKLRDLRKRIIQSSIIINGGEASALKRSDRR